MIKIEIIFIENNFLYKIYYLEFPTLHQVRAFLTTFCLSTLPLEFKEPAGFFKMQMNQIQRALIRRNYWSYRQQFALGKLSNEAFWRHHDAT